MAQPKIQTGDLPEVLGPVTPGKSIKDIDTEDFNLLDLGEYTQMYPSNPKELRMKILAIAKKLMTLGIPGAEAIKKAATLVTGGGGGSEEVPEELRTLLKGIRPERTFPEIDWDKIPKDIDKGFRIPEPEVHPDAPQVGHHFDINPLQTMEFRDANQDGIEDRSQGIYAEDRDVIPWDFNKPKYLAQGGRANYSQGGRTGYQAGTAVTQIRPDQFIQDIGADYAKQLVAGTAAPLPTAQFAPAVAAQTGLQQQATTAATAGLGAYQPYLTGAGAAGVAPGAAPMGAEAYAGLTGAAGLQGPMTGQQLTDYMSPYQQQVIDTSLAEFDRQAAMRQQGISDAAVGLGGYGGGREGVMQAEYQTQSDRNRAMLQAGLQQQGFTQAQGARQQDYLNRLGLAQAQQGLGSYQAGLGAATQQQLGADVGLAGRIGSVNQAQAQAELDAIREANRLAAYEPLERLGMYGTGVTGLMGGYPAQYQFTSQPGPTPLQSALGIASVGGGLYGNIYGPQRPKFMS